MVYFQVPTDCEDGGLVCLKAHLHISVEADVLKGGRGEQSKDINGGGWKILCVHMSLVHSIKPAMAPVCVIPV